MKLNDFLDNGKSRQIAFCPVRTECPFSYLCGVADEEGKVALPESICLEQGDMQWTDLSARRKVFAVKSGVVVSKVYANNDRETPLSIFRHGYNIGLNELFTSYIPSEFYYVEALSAGELCAFDNELARQRMLALDAQTSQTILSSVFTNQATMAYGSTLTHAHPYASQRIASVLLRLHWAFSAEECPERELPVTNERIAFLSFCERVAVNRALNDFVREDLVAIGYRKVTLKEKFFRKYGSLVEASLPFYLPDGSQTFPLGRGSC